MNQDFEEKQPKQPGFFWLFEWSENAEKFNDHQLADFVRAMVAAAKGEDYELQDDPLVELAFKYANRDRERMDYQRVVKSENGSKGGAQIGNKNASKQPKNNRKQPKTTENKLKDKDKDKYIDKDIVNNNPLTGVYTPAPERIGFEFFGIMKNVQLSAQQHRTLVENYGEELVNSTIDDLSCKLADGRSDSLNHYATIYQWLNRSHMTTPRNAPPSSMQLTDAEKRQIWERLSEKDKQEYLDTHEGMTPWQYDSRHGND